MANRNKPRIKNLKSKFINRVSSNNNDLDGNTNNLDDEFDEFEEFETEEKNSRRRVWK